MALDSKRKTDRRYIFYCYLSYFTRNYYYIIISDVTQWRRFKFPVLGALGRDRSDENGTSMKKVNECYANSRTNLWVDTVDVANNRLARLRSSRLKVQNPNVFKCIKKKKKWLQDSNFSQNPYDFTKNR